MKPLGAVACGHAKTAEAAELILRAGGNAFDAILAAHFMACIVEPVLASLGGGGFLLAHRRDGRDVIYDFFAQTPQTDPRKNDLDFYPILANFGTASQEFHIGLGSAAVPGAIKGIFKIHNDLCSLPLEELARPAIEAARQGVPVNAFQAYIFDIVSPILSATPEARQLYQSAIAPKSLIVEGELLRHPQMADFLEILVKEGDDWFYRGEMAHNICQMSANDGGLLTLQDLADYEVILRDPVAVRYGQHYVLTNPPPSCGGTLIAFALSLLEALKLEQCAFGTSQHLLSLATAMSLTNEARIDSSLNAPSDTPLQRLLDPQLVRQYREKIAGNLRALHGTTHISVMDNLGNVAGMTVSNGEGSGHLIPDTGVMLNNMLGEEDLNPGGFFRWRPSARLTSMMAPTLVRSPQGGILCLGSGGSNRLRTAILQVLINIIDFGFGLDDAVNHPRIHFENDLLSVEPGFDAVELAALYRQFGKYHEWDRKNLFFGGVHAVSTHQGGFDGTGDQRRGGVATIIA